MTKITPEFQEAAFYKYALLSSKLLKIGRFIQNDFELLIEDGNTTREQIKKELIQFKEEFQKAEEIMQELKAQSTEILEHYAGVEESIELPSGAKVEINQSNLENTLSSAVEFGYTQCEKGENIQKAISTFKELMRDSHNTETA